MQASNYSLNLYFSHSITEAPTNKATYDCESGTINCVLTKEKPGEKFTDLDMVSKLLTPPELFTHYKVTPSLIEVVKSTPNQNIEEEKKEPTEILNTQISNELKITTKCLYGFNNQYSDVFTYKTEEQIEICHLNPEKIAPEDRFIEKCKKEQNDFDSEHYLCDTFETEQIDEIMSTQNPLAKIAIDLLSNDVSQLTLNASDYTEDEFMRIKSLKNKEFIEIDKNYVLLLITDILYGYCYDQRSMNYEPTSESHWTISTLSATLSCHVDWMGIIKEITAEKAIKHMIISCIRRSLIYPLYRNYKLSMKVWDDVIVLLRCHRKHVLKTLISIQRLFEIADPKYLLNILYINDLCICIQKHINEEDLQLWISTLEKQCKAVTKSETELKLNEIEEECNSAK